MRFWSKFARVWMVFSNFGQGNIRPFNSMSWIKQIIRKARAVDIKLVEMENYFANLNKFLNDGWKLTSATCDEEGCTVVPT